MALLSDIEIEMLCDGDAPMISPFRKQLMTTYNGIKMLSSGPSSHGYDLTLADKVQVFDVGADVVDVKEFNPTHLTTLDIHRDNSGSFVIMPPMSYVLGHSVEILQLPGNISAICQGKSTYARGGIVVPMTPVEAGFVGQLTIELSNLLPRRNKLYIQEGIVQLLFFKNSPCSVEYGARRGKYQDQVGITYPKV